MTATVEFSSLIQNDGSGLQVRIVNSLINDADRTTPDESLNVLSWHRVNAKQQDQRSLKLLRRLNGFFIQKEGDQARVAFLENDELIHYWLPYQRLKDSGVTVENQPFEMDEFETTVEGVSLKGYRFTPAVPANSFRLEAINLGQQQKDKLNKIFSVFEKHNPDK